MLLRNAQGIAETLIMNDLALAQIAKDVSYVGIVAKTNQIVIGGTRFLLCCYRSRATKSTLAGG